MLAAELELPAEPAVVVSGPGGQRELIESPSLEQIEAAVDRCPARAERLRARRLVRRRRWTDRWPGEERDQHGGADPEDRVGGESSSSWLPR